MVSKVTASSAQQFIKINGLPTVARIALAALGLLVLGLTAVIIRKMHYSSDSSSFSPEGEEKLRNSKKPASLLLGNTNSKHLGEGVRLLATVTKHEEDQCTAKMARKDVSMGSARIVVCEPNQPFFLYTDGLGPCVAALAFCRLRDGKRLMGCAHITPMNRDIELLNNLIEKLKTQPNYQGEKIEFYFAGGDCDFGSNSNSENYDSYCLYVKNQMNLELRGILFDPFQLTHDISHAIDWPYSLEEVVLAKENSSKKNEMDIEFNEARHIGSLLSCRAGITSEGEPLIRKLVDISFEFNPLKFSNYKKIKQYCLLHSKIDITRIECGVFD